MTLSTPFPVEYLDFELRIGERNGTEYSITVIHAAAGGEPAIMTTMPVDDELLRDQLNELDHVRSAKVAAQRSVTDDRNVRPSSSMDSSSMSEAAIARTIGERLFDSLIVGTVRDAYTSSLVRAREQDAGLRLRLTIDAPEVAALPWEFLYDAQEGDHVSLLREIPLTRYTALTRDHNTLDVTPPLRILGMVATPTNLQPLDVDQEKQRIERALEHLLERGDVDLQWVAGDTWEALQTALDSNEWHVFHFIGHGTFDPIASEGQLAFCTEQGDFHPLSATALGRIFAGHRSLRLAFLNACEGGRTSDAELFSSVGAVLTRRGVPAVISMQFNISDRAALEFSRLFYDSLARGNSVDVAVTQARTGLSISLPDRVEWATPMLHMHSPDGNLFTVNTSASIFDQSKTPQGQHSQSGPNGGFNSSTSSASATNSSPHPNLGKQDQKGLNILHRKVQQFWIEGVLENSLYLKTLHDLGMVVEESAVENPYGTYVERPDQPSQPLGQEQSVVDVFDEYGGSLLFLGEPGSGKTTAMLNLTQTLLQRSNLETGPNASSAVPVVFNLSSWNPSYSMLEEWLAEQMSLQYNVPKGNSLSLIKAGTILPLLDGLDETAEELRDRCVEAINEYVLARNLTGLVVCCRLTEYVGLPLRLALNTAIRLTELTDEQIDAYLSNAGQQLAGLRDLLRRESTLRIDARSPLWLNLMVRSYHGLSVIDLAQESDGSARDRRRQLMNAYIDRMYRRVREGQ